MISRGAARRLIVLHPKQNIEQANLLDFVHQMHQNETTQ